MASRKSNKPKPASEKGRAPVVRFSDYARTVSDEDVAVLRGYFSGSREDDINNSRTAEEWARILKAETIRPILSGQ